MILEALKQRAKLIDMAIDEYIPIVEPEEMYCAMRHLLDAGGKRLRPSALILGAEIVGGNPEDVLPAAIAVELIHNFTLIHDDIMDEADIRRGLTTVHRKWSIGGAIIAGDALYSKAFELIAKSRSDPERIVESVAMLSNACTKICEGQWLDINFQSRDNVTEEEYIDMVMKKTAVLFAASLKIGAILSNANEKQAHALWEFGLHAGVGFQIYDDVIDLITPEEILGKTQAGDIIEGKRTLIVIHALSKGVRIQALGKANATKSEVSDALSLLKECGSIDYAMHKAVNFVEKGKSFLSIFPDSEPKRILSGLADYMIKRKY